MEPLLIIAYLILFLFGLFIFIFPILLLDKLNKMLAVLREIERQTQLTNYEANKERRARTSEHEPAGQM